jgi:hypothetical protein
MDLTVLFCVIHKIISRGPSIPSGIPAVVVHKEFVFILSKAFQFDYFRLVEVFFVICVSAQDFLVEIKGRGSAKAGGILAVIGSRLFNVHGRRRNGCFLRS